MSIKDYLYLSSLNIRRNPSRSLKTILSLSIGFIFTILSFFAVFSFFFGLTSKMDNNKDFNSFSIKYYTETQYFVNHDETFYEIDKNYYIKEAKESFEDFDGLIYATSYSNVSFSTTYESYAEKNPSRVAHIKIDEKIFPYYTSGFYTTSVGVFDKFEVNHINTISNEKYGIDFLVAGRNIENKNELLVSARLLQVLGLNIEFVLNKNISVTSGSIGYTEIDNMRIVGVYNPMLKEKEFETNPYGNDFLALSNSYYFLKEQMINEEITYTKDSDYEGYGICIIKNNDSMIRKFLYFDSFEYSKKAYDYMIKKYNYEQLQNCFEPREHYEDYIGFHDSINNITVFLSAVGICIIIIAMLNIFDMIGYNVVKRRKNVGMMKALGLKDNESFKIYLSEFTLYVIISTIISFIVTFIIAGVFTISSNMNLKFDSLGYDIGAAINFWYYFLALGIVIGAIYSIAYLYIWIVTKKLVKDKPIVLLK